jgi:hypothetical protein
MTLQLNGETNRLETHKNSISSFLSTRINFWLRFDKNPFEWVSNARLDEGFNLSDLDLDHLTTAPDELRLHSIFYLALYSLVWTLQQSRTSNKSSSRTRKP